MPRVSEGCLPSDYLDYMKGNNNNSLEQQPEKKDQPAINFAKYRKESDLNVSSPGMVERGIIEKTEEQKKYADFKGRSMINSVTSPNRRSSVDLAQFYKPLTNSSSPLRKKKIFGVDDFQKIKELGSGKYGRVMLVK
jgi:hypothetical protein